MIRWSSCLSIVALTVAAPAYAADGEAGTASVQPVSATGEKLRCKRYVETGTLAKIRKECHTKADWDLLLRQGKEDAKTMLWNTVTGTATNG